MSDNRIEGAAKKAGGAIQEGAGKVLGDSEMEAKGAAKKTEGSVQNTAGKVQDKVGDAIKKA